MTRGGWDSLANVATIASWASFGGLWVAGAAYNRRHAPAVARRGSGRSGWVAVAAGVWLLFEVVPDHAWESLAVSAAWLRTIGVAVLVVATGFTLWARVVLGRMWSSAVLLREDHELRRGGPYAITRHPIYTGILGMLIGTALLNGGRWIVVVLVAIVYVVVKARAEERLLTALFPGEYERYRERVPQLIPYAKRR